MNSAQIRQVIESMASLPGIHASALVDAEAGMVWHCSGQKEGLDALAEAATDYWRLYTRLHKQFESLGDLQNCVMMHAHGMIAITPCGGSMVVVAIAQRMQADWNQWQIKIRELIPLLANI